MSDVPTPEARSAFVRSLLRTARDEAPPAGAKARALAGLASTPAVASLAATRASRVAAAWLGGAVAVAAAAAVVVVARGHVPAPSAPVIATAERFPETPLPAPASGAPTPAHAAAPARAAAPAAGACERVALEDREPAVCSEPGRREAIEITNTCGEAVDVFWVDFKCRETFVARLGAGETMRHQTYDTHPWRVRDHATHRLLKEWVGPAQPEPTTERVALPDVVIADRASAPDQPPLVCSFPSDPASLRFVNQRTTGVSVVFWVDFDCKEHLYRRLDPGETWSQETYSAHPWRVRDESGALLVDFVPDGADRTVYVAVP